MSKKVFILLLIINMSIISVNAASIVKVIAQNEFSTQVPSEKMNVKLKKDYNLGNYEFKSGDILECNITKTVRPKIGKRNARFYVEPYAYISDEEEIQIETTLKGKYVKGIISKEDLVEADKGKIAKKVAIKAGDTYMKTMVPGYSVVKGMVLNEEGNIVKSGLKEVYKDSPFSFLGKGRDVYILPGEEFCLMFSKPKDMKKSKDLTEEEQQAEVTEITEENTEEI